MSEEFEMKRFAAVAGVCVLLIAAALYYWAAHSPDNIRTLVIGLIYCFSITILAVFASTAYAGWIRHVTVAQRRTLRPAHSFFRYLAFVIAMLLALICLAATGVLITFSFQDNAIFQAFGIAVSFITQLIVYSSTAVLGIYFYPAIVRQGASTSQ